MSHAVLIIEDEPTLAKNMKQYLDRHGFEVRTVASAEDGLKQIDEYKPDVVLLDFHLPGMDGMQALAQIRSRDSQIRLIMITGHSSVQMAVDAMKAGAHDYLTKPVVLSELKLRLEKVLGQDRMEQALSYYQQKEAEQGGMAQLIGTSPPMQLLKATIRQLLEAEQRLGTTRRHPCSSPERPAAARSWWRARCTSTARGARGRSSRSIAPPSPHSCSKPSYSATSAARLPTRADANLAWPKRPTAALCSSTRSATSSWSCRASCSSCSKKKWCGASAACAT